MVKFVGTTRFGPGTFVGLDVPAGTGSCDGTVAGEKYFESSAGKGAFGATFVPAAVLGRGSMLVPYSREIQAASKITSLARMRREKAKVQAKRDSAAWNMVGECDLALSHAVDIAPKLTQT